MDLSQKLKNAIQVCSNLSRDAKAEGDLPTMYASNRAWHQLTAAHDDLDKRRARLSKRVSSNQRVEK